MTEREPAWDAFATELRHSLKLLGMTTAQLCTALDIPGLGVETVANWRKGRARPRLSYLPRIAEILQAGQGPDDDRDPLHLLRQMGLLPPKPASREIIDAAYGLQKLELKLSDAEDRAATMGQREGAAAVVRAAIATGRWAVAVWPATEGPDDCRLRIADRIDITRCDDGPPATAESVWQDRELNAALRNAYALPGVRVPRWASDNDNAVSRWSISHVGAPMSPAVSTAHPRLRSVAFTALTVDSWVNVVASLTALALGYGLTTTRDLAMETFGLPAGATSPESATRPEHRTVVHRELLRRAPSKRVWSHHAPLAHPRTSTFTSPREPWRTDVVHIWLRESDALLEQWLTTRGDDHQLDALRQDREFLTNQIRDLPNPNQVVSLDVQLPREGQQQLTQRWNQALHGVKHVLNELVRRDLLTGDLTAVHRHTETAKPTSNTSKLLAWLRAHDCLAVRGHTMGSRPRDHK